MAREIDRKLRLTAALLGAVTRKDLAAAFRAVNRATSFDIDRADKWLQGRAHPRQAQIYEDWAKVLDIGRSGHWIAECDLESFLREICTRHQRDPEDLRRQLERSVAAPRPTPAYDLTGTYVCYSHAWSPYFRGRLIRGELVVSAGSGPNRLGATYTEILPIGPMVFVGTGALSTHELRLDVHDASGSAHVISFVLFSPKPPASVLAGLMFGTTVIGPDPQPSVSRIAMIRLPGPSQALRTLGAYLPEESSVAADLLALGLPVTDPSMVDHRMAAFLGSVETGGFDQVSNDVYRPLVEQFDLNWLRAHDVAGPAPQEPQQAPA